MNDWLYLKSSWGMDGSMEYQFQAIQDAGYDGIDGQLPPPEQERLFISLLAEYGFFYVPLIQTEGPDHFASFQKKAERALEFSPLLINSHTGRDTLSVKERSLLFEKILRFEEELPVPVAHETHRSRVTFSPIATLELVREFPALWLTADFSHWCCVCESLLEDLDQAIAEISKHVIHIHGRVGYSQGPQVPDPAAPEYAAELAAHEKWWLDIVLELRAKKEKVVFAAEYGPGSSRYLHTLPYTDQAVADVWNISLWATNRFKEKIMKKF
jgi:hypothetical protein